MALGSWSHETFKGRASGGGARSAVEPSADAEQIECDRAQNVLEMGFGLTNVATAAQATDAERLRKRPLNTCSRRIGCRELHALLTESRRTQRDLLLARMEGDGPQGRLRAPGSRGTRSAIAC